MQPWAKSVAKRVADVALALALTPVALPTVAIACIAVMLDSPGYPLICQQRSGRGGGVLRLMEGAHDVRGCRREHSRISYS